MGLRETLEAATREYEDARNDVELADIRKARWELDALAPELAALALDMGEQLEVENEKHPNHNITKLLARLDRLGKEQT